MMASHTIELYTPDQTQRAAAQCKPGAPGRARVKANTLQENCEKEVFRVNV